MCLLFISLGSKQDSWIAVDVLTGRKLYSFSSHDGLNSMCPPNQYGTNKIIHIPSIGKNLLPPQ